MRIIDLVLLCLSNVLCSQIHFQYRHSGFQTNVLPASLNLGEDFPFDLHVQLLPFINKIPTEFSHYNEGEKHNINVRRWHFTDIQKIPDVLFDEVVCGQRKFKVVRIGNAPGNIPPSDCWWLNKSTERIKQIRTFEVFTKSLTPFKYPLVTDMKQVKLILDHWISGKIVITKNINQSYITSL